MYFITFRTVNIPGESIDYKVYAHHLEEAEQKLIALYSPFDDAPPKDPPIVCLVSVVEVEPWTIPAEPKDRLAS